MATATNNYFRSSQGLEIRTVLGDIITTTADAIVISEGERFKHLGVVGKILSDNDPTFVKKRKELKEKLKSSEDIVWNAFTSKLGNRFDHVIHAVIKPPRKCHSLAEWKDFMQILYYKIFQEAERQEINNIALPLLGSGKGKAPVEDAIDVVLKAAYSFKKKTLERIDIVSQQDDVYEEIVRQCEQRSRKKARGSSSMSVRKKERTCKGLEHMPDTSVGHLVSEPQISSLKSLDVGSTLLDMTASIKVSSESSGREREDVKKSQKKGLLITKTKTTQTPEAQSDVANTKRNDEVKKKVTESIGQETEEVCSKLRVQSADDTEQSCTGARRKKQRARKTVNAANTSKTGFGIECTKDCRLHEPGTDETQNRIFNSMTDLDTVLDEEALGGNQSDNEIKKGANNDEWPERYKKYPRNHELTMPKDGQTKQLSKVSKAGILHRTNYKNEEMHDEQELVSEAGCESHVTGNISEMSDCGADGNTMSMNRGNNLTDVENKRKRCESAKSKKSTIKGSCTEAVELQNQDQSERKKDNGYHRTRDKPLKKERCTTEVKVKKLQDRNQDEDDQIKVQVQRKDETKVKRKVKISKENKEMDNKQDDICPICMDSITDPKKLTRCGHVFCTDCIANSFQHFKPVCPSCNMVYGTITGNQPVGIMKVVRTRDQLPGHEGFGTINIIYIFPSGIQERIHPNPGQPYKGTTRYAYLPDNQEGRDVLKLLRIAFDRKLTFTIGHSTTTGLENVVTWNDIHHKTNKTGGSTGFGYPDETYLKRVREELESKGVV